MTNRRRFIAIVVVVMIPIMLVVGFFILRDWVLPTFASPSVTGVPTIVDTKMDSLKTNQAQTHIAQTATPSAATAAPSPGS